MTGRTEEQGTRAGRYVKQLGGYRAFMPRPLPPPELRIDDELLDMLSKADQAVGRLDAGADMLPNPDLFVGMYVRKEAVLSSQIEGTQASLTDVLEYEALGARRRFVNDVGEVINYVRAMDYGLQRTKELPLSSRLLREIHKELLKGVRGAERLPGEFRRSQNWIGPPGCDLSTAAFVPPPPHEVEQAMAALEAYMRSDNHTPVLIKTGLIHAQFETIHPFLDGNGRMGRLLVTFYLCQQDVLKRPLLYLSAYFKQFREEYYERLQRVRDSGDWEGWLKFFSRATWHVSREAGETIHKILALREKHRQLIQEQMKGPANGLKLLDLLFEHPYTFVSYVKARLQVSYPTANSLIQGLAQLGLVREITGRGRYRVFMYVPYVELLQQGIGLPGEVQR